MKGFGNNRRSIVRNLDHTLELDDSVWTREFYERCVDVKNLQRTTLAYQSMFDAPIAAVASDQPTTTTTTQQRLRGVIATRNIAKGQDIIDIPYDRAINLGLESQDPTIPAMQFLKDYYKTIMIQSITDTDDNDPPQDRDSKASYYRMLPTWESEDCRGSTDFFSDEALEQLQSPWIVEETLQRRALVQERMMSHGDASTPWIHNDPDNHNHRITTLHLQWAVWLVTSRVLTVQGNDGRGYRLLIPYLDMCNHHRESPHILTGRAEPGGRLRIVAGKHVKVGESIEICYGGGVAGNDRFLQDYGFLDDHSMAYDIVAQELLGRRKIREGKRAGLTISEVDRERTLRALRTTTRSQDAALLETETNFQIRTAIRYRLDLKNALAKYIVMP
jgi:hypothetical protein